MAHHLFFEGASVDVFQTRAEAEKRFVFVVGALRRARRAALAPSYGYTLEERPDKPAAKGER